MKSNIAPLEVLIEQFERLPGIGRKSAQRLAFYVLNMPKEQAKKFSSAILNAHDNIKRCNICCNLTDSEKCSICSNTSRNQNIICVVEDTRDVMAIERTGEFDGLYHVLHGVISPMNGIGPDDLSIKELIARLKNPDISEIIMATNPTVEGEATSMYLSRLIKPMNIRTTRLAYGVPVGAVLEYADEITLSKALEGRREF